jgi:DNA-binding beta-propeller fold protein YncE
MKNINRLQIIVAIGLAGLVWMGAGCATTQKSAKQTIYFFPPPPDEPHFQYLTSFSSEKEFRGGTDRSFMNFVTGAAPLERDLAKPYGVAAHGNKIYICDTEFGAVIVLDLPTRRMHLFAAEGEGALKLPLNMTVDADGNCYVSDSERDQVVIFDKQENYVAAMGTVGEMKPRDVAVSADKIYVADLQKHCVRVFDKVTRAPLFDIPRGEDATNHSRQIFTPTNLALDSKGNLYVGDTGAFHVIVFDADGKYLRTVGEFGDGPGQFARLKGVAVDRDSRLYAVDAMSQVIQVFDESGRLLTWFGDPTASQATQNLPAKVMIDYDDVNYFQSYVAPSFKVEYLVFVINQLGPHKVSVYGYGSKK